MARKNEPYSWVIVESFRPSSTGGLHGDIHVRPVPGQGLDTNMFVECSKELVNNYEVGTRYLGSKQKLQIKKAAVRFCTAISAGITKCCLTSA